MKRDGPMTMGPQSGYTVSIVKYHAFRETFGAFTSIPLDDSNPQCWIKGVMFISRRSFHHLDVTAAHGLAAGPSLRSPLRFTMGVGCSLDDLPCCTKNDASTWLQAA